MEKPAEVQLFPGPDLALSAIPAMAITITVLSAIVIDAAVPATVAICLAIAFTLIDLAIRARAEQAGVVTLRMTASGGSIHWTDNAGRRQKGALADRNWSSESYAVLHCIHCGSPRSFLVSRRKQSPYAFRMTLGWIRAGNPAGSNT